MSLPEKLITWLISVIGFDYIHPEGEAEKVERKGGGRGFFHQFTGMIPGIQILREPAFSALFVRKDAPPPMRKKAGRTARRVLRCSPEKTQCADRQTDRRAGRYTEERSRKNEQVNLLVLFPQ